MTIAEALRVTPVCINVRTYSMSACHTNNVHSLKLNNFDQNFMKLGHIVKYHNVFFKSDNGPYRTMPSGVIAPLFMKIHLF